jgi:hypothetical protein
LENILVAAGEVLGERKGVLKGKVYGYGLKKLLIQNLRRNGCD